MARIPGWRFPRAIRLPTVPQSACAAAHGDRKEALMTQPPLVLIVDDDQMLRDMLQDFLDDVGYQTMTASDGAAGLDMLGQAAPDLVLLDVAMPVMDGLTF